MEWRKFEDLARKEIEKKLKCDLRGGKIDITGKDKKFDLINKNKRIVVDVKYYSTTKTGNTPAAKFSILNEYVWLMQRLEKSDKHKWKKILVIGTDKKLVENYFERYREWLDDIEVYYFDKKKITIIDKQER